MALADERLYYNDSYLTTFSANVLAAERRDEEWHVLLSQSAFYPTSGGQPHDTGTLGSSPVTDVYVNEGKVWHVVRSSTEQPFAAGMRVSGEVDWHRRFDFMQQHCGQHILSASFEQLFDIDTIGFHLGDEWVTVDLEVSEIDWAQIERAELLANQVIWEDRPILARFLDDTEMASLSLRHPPKVTEDIRVVTIEGFDNNACGGTHPRRTGAVGQLKVVRSERMRQGIRLTFVCGARALRDYQHRTHVIRELGQLLSASSAELIDAVSKLQQTVVQGRKTEQDLLARLASATAKSLVEAAEHQNSMQVLIAPCEGASDVSEFRALAASVASAFGPKPYVAALGMVTSDRIHIQTVASGDSGVDASDWLKSTLAPFGGKGGGNAAAAQGAVPVQEGAGLTEVLAAFRNALPA